MYAQFVLVCFLHVLALFWHAVMSWLATKDSKKFEFRRQWYNSKYLCLPQILCLLSHKLQLEVPTISSWRRQPHLAQNTNLSWKKTCLSLGKYLNDVTASKHGPFSLCRRPGLTFIHFWNIFSASEIQTCYLVHSGSGGASASAQSFLRQQMNQTTYKRGNGLLCSRCVFSHFGTFQRE